MPKPRRIPYFVVEANVSENTKLAALPNDEARLGYFYACLGRGKLQRPQGRFASRSHWRDVVGRFARHLNKYIAAGLMHEAPLTCRACIKDWPDAQPGQLFVHNFLRHQIDPWAAERAEEWRSITADQTLIERGSNDDQTAIERKLEPSDHRSITDDRTPASPARASGRVSAPSVETSRHRDVETESLRETKEDRSPSRVAKPERIDVQALLDRGWKRVTAKQRAVLDEVLGLHNVTGPAWAAQIISDTPPDADALAAVKAAHEDWQRQERQRVDQADAEWRDTKAKERAEAAEAYERLYGAQP